MLFGTWGHEVHVIGAMRAVFQTKSCCQNRHHPKDPSGEPETLNEIPALFIRLQNMRDAAWKAYIRRDFASALELAALIEETAKKLKESLK